MMIRPSKVASKAFGLGTLEILEVDLGRTKGSKPRMMGMARVPFWINPEDDSTIACNTKTTGAKLSTWFMLSLELAPLNPWVSL